uniref:Uncharacterized protein n=1 Tax=Anguilla anguilla TaxID=7936 RepID=A0A0E9WKV5_ANGAN
MTFLSEEKSSQFETPHLKLRSLYRIEDQQNLFNIKPVWFHLHVNGLENKSYTISVTAV